MRALIIGILVLFLITLGCVNSTPNTATNDAATNETTPTTNIPPETIETTPPSENTIPPTETIPPVENTPLEVPDTYTLADVATHNKTSDCWTAIQGKVYDITKYIPNHPGGSVILQACGKDGTTLFETRNGNGPHPANATKTLEKYYLGELSA